MKIVLGLAVGAVALSLAGCGTPYGDEPITAYQTPRDWKGATDCLDDALLLQPVHVVTERDSSQHTSNVYLNNEDNRHVGVIVVGPSGRGAAMSAQTLDSYVPVAQVVAGACQRS